jgi:iduronate 2-sulfatase
MPQAMGYSIRSKRFRYTEWRDFKSGEVRARELYDHQNDHAETLNLAGDNKHADTLAKLAGQLNDVLEK